MTLVPVTSHRPAAHRATPRFRDRAVAAHHLLLTVAGFGLLVGATFLLGPVRTDRLATAAAYLCVTAGLTVLVGTAGQLSLGHGALMATGAYTVALLQDSYGQRGPWVLPLAVAAGVLVTIGVGAVLGFAAARPRGPYLAGVTLAVALAVPVVTTLAAGVLGGDRGLPVYPGPPPGPPARASAWLALAAAAATLFVLANLLTSRVGREFRAVRDDEVAAGLAGIPGARTRVLAFVVSAACAGLGGALLAVLDGSVSPGGFAPTLSLALLLAVVIGGAGSLAGAVWAAVLLVLLPDAGRALAAALPVGAETAGRLAEALPLAALGLGALVVVLAVPGGLQGLLGRRHRGRPRRREGGPA
jgi:branched-chain amino acid transport system permease protein